MEVFQREKKYMVYPYDTEVLVDVMTNEKGDVVLYKEHEDEEEWYETHDRLRFFNSEEDAKEYAQQFVIHNKEDVKKYIQRHAWNNEILAEILPDTVMGWIETGKNGIVFSWQEKELLYKAISGIFNINAVSFRREEVSHIEYLQQGNIRIVLKSGKKVTTETVVEKIIIEAAFGKNISGKCF